MKETKFGAEGLKKLLTVLDKYKYVLLVVLAGALLLLIPTGDEEPPRGAGAALVQETDTEGFDLEKTERKLSAALSQVEGAGEVTVVLTVQNSSRQVLAQDGTNTQKDGASEQTAETVVVSKGSGTQETVLVEQIYPDFQGALVVCTGGEDAAVRLKLVEAVSALTGLGADKISICKGK